ncbi:hypothetical protein ACEWAR_24045, partial [Vibrio parahaemolyticus]
MDSNNIQQNQVSDIALSKAVLSNVWELIPVVETKQPISSIFFYNTPDYTNVGDVSVSHANAVELVDRQDYEANDLVFDADSRTVFTVTEDLTYQATDLTDLINTNKLVYTSLSNSEQDSPEQLNFELIQSRSPVKTRKLRLNISTELEQDIKHIYDSHEILGYELAKSINTEIAHKLRLLSTPEQHTILGGVGNEEAKEIYQMLCLQQEQFLKNHRLPASGYMVSGDVFSLLSGSGYMKLYGTFGVLRNGLPVYPYSFMDSVSYSIAVCAHTIESDYAISNDSRKNIVAPIVFCPYQSALATAVDVKCLHNTYLTQTRYSIVPNYQNNN